MIRIPNLVPAMDDELMYSYLYRLSIINGYTSVHNFYVKFLDLQDTAVKQSKYYDRYEINMNLKSLFDALEEYVDHFDPADFFIRHSMYGLTSSLMSPRARINKLNVVFGQTERHKAFCILPPANIKHLRYCPDCKKEDKAIHGFFWYRRIHQMPGIKVCHIHGTPLREIIERRGHEWDETLAEHVPEILNIEIEKKYAAFIQEYANLALQNGGYNLKQVIWSAYSKNSKDELLRVQNGDVIQHMKETGVRPIDRRGLNGGSKYDNERFFWTMFALIKMPDSLKEYFGCDTEDKYLMQSAMERERYKVIGTCRNDLVVLRHMACKKVFYTTPEGFAEGWRCPYCDKTKSDTAFMIKLIEEGTNKEYICKSGFKGLNKPIRIQHCLCGKNYDVKLNDFLDGKRCKCGLDNSIKRRITTHSRNVFSVLGYNEKTDQAYIRHEQCHRVFRIKLELFNSECIFCNLQAREKFAKKVKDLVGDEYSVCGEVKNYTTPVRIRHEVCGRESLIKPASFYVGVRCRHCRSSHEEAYYIEAVKQISNGVYQIKRSHREYYNITDTRSGKSQMLKIRLIMQELMRPTPSTILPLESKGNLEKSNEGASYVMKVTDWVLKNRIDRKYFSIHEICQQLSLKESQVIRALKRRKKTNQICRISSRYPVYIYKKEDIPEVISELFIASGSDVYGISTKDSFLYELGYISEKPGVERIMSSNIDVDRLTISIKGYNYIITRSNTKITAENHYCVSLLKFYQWNRFGHLLDPVFQDYCKKYIDRHGITMDALKKLSPEFDYGIRQVGKWLFNSQQVN